MRLTTFGESHGTGVGGVLDGFPAGIEVDLSRVLHDLMRRRPGQSNLTSPREESDAVDFLSGIFNGKSLGSPIAFLIRNRDFRPEDYAHLENLYRPSHADYTYEKKYGIRDPRGGGRSSARETAARVVGGALAKMLLAKQNIQVRAWVSQIGPIQASLQKDKITSGQVEVSPVRCPDPEASEAMVNLIEGLKASGDSTGGLITCLVKGVPAGIGEPVFDKLQACLAHAMLSINATKGFDFGSGFEAPAMKGSEHNDAFVRDEAGNVTTRTNFSGGIQGGISNGEEIIFRVAFKPVATIAKEQDTIDRDGKPVRLSSKGRHDPCVVPRAVPIVEAMAALVIADHILLNKAASIT